MSFLLPPEFAARLHAAVARRMLTTGRRYSKNDLVAEALEQWLMIEENGAQLARGRTKKKSSAAA